MHRLKVGHFTQTKHWEILGFPILSKPHDLISPVPILFFQQPDDLFNATNVKLFHGEQLDYLLIASREGISWLYFNQNLKEWKIDNIGHGEQGENQQTNYYGSSSVDIGRVGNDPFGYIAAAEPFHGNVISAYTKNINSMKQVEWKRHVLDVYGHANEQGEGSSHHLVYADFDKDGEEEFLVALREPSPNQDVYFYKLVNHSHVIFAKWKLSGNSAARIAVADYDNDGLLDFATIGFDAPGFSKSENSSINIFYNRFSQKKQQIQK